MQTIQKITESTSLAIISAAECIDLRSRVLRPGLPLEQSHYLEDNDPTTFHLGVVFDNKIVANGTFMKNTAPIELTQELNCYRLRGMATFPEFKGLGYGSLILNSAEKILKERQCPLLWFNARVAAFEFYEKNGYRYFGEMFEIPQVGPHKVMWKSL